MLRSFMNKRLFAVLTLVLVLLIAAAALFAMTTSTPLAGIPTSATVIDLRSTGLTSLPAEIGQYTAATQLLLDDNQLKGALPAEIRKLTGLEIISAKHNQLTGIPAEIGQLHILKHIDLSDNQITTYPNELLQLQQPLILNISGNPFTAEQVAALRAALPNADIQF